MLAKNKIWILDSDKLSHDFFHGVLGNTSELRFFSTIHDLASTLKSLNEYQFPDLLITDISFPDGSLLDMVAKVLRIRTNRIKFLVTSLQSDYDSMRNAFNLGALDYLIKPVTPNALLVKTELILQQQNKKYEFPELDILNATDLTKKELQILKLLMNAGENFVDRESICSFLWGSTLVHPKTLDVHLFNLRKKIKRYGYQIMVKSGSYMLDRSGHPSTPSNSILWQTAPSQWSRPTNL